MSAVRLAALALVCLAGSLGCSKAVAVPGSETAGIGPGSSPEAEPSEHPIEARFSELVVGPSTACVRVDKRELWCWGTQLGYLTPTSLHRAEPLEAGWGSLPERCTIGTGRLRCERELPKQLRNIVDVDVTHSRACAVLESGEVHCWERREPDQTELLGVVPGAVEVEVFGLGKVCVRTDAGELACSGGELPRRDGSDDPALARVAGVEGVAALELGRWHGCMLDRVGRVRCFGANDYGQLGVGDTKVHAQPVEVSLPGAASELAVSDQQSCVLLTDEVRCWGGHDLLFGPPHHGEFEFEFEATALHVQGSSSCASKADGSLWCWGLPDLSTLPFDNLGGAQRAAVPQLVPSPWPINEFHTVGIRSGDEFIFARTLMWPFGMFMSQARPPIEGVTGFAADDYDTICVYGGKLAARCFEFDEPVAVPELSAVSDMAIGRQSMCVVRRGRVSCLARSNPIWVAVSGLKDMVSVACNDQHACALGKDGRITCWYGTTDDDGRYTVSEGTHVLAESDAAQMAWGLSGLFVRTKKGALRFGAATRGGAPFEQRIAEGVLEVAGSGSHACARVDRDGDGISERIACFGDDRVGQLGRLGDHVRLRPTPISFVGATTP